MDDITLGFWIGLISATIVLLLSQRNYYLIHKDSKLYNKLKEEGYKPSYKFWFNKQ